MAATSNYDVVVIGAGVFGSWTTWHLAQRKQKVLMLDAYGAAHSRASSGGETRIIRMSYASISIPAPGSVVPMFASSPSR